MSYAALKALLLERGRGRGLVWRTFLTQVYFTAVQAIPLLGVAALLVGVVVFFISAQLLGGWGLASEIRPTAEVILKELMPLIAILVIIGRSGTAMAAELGTMKVNREDEILDSMAINMDYFVIFPRIMGMIASLLVLNLFVFALSILGGEWMARQLGLLPDIPAWSSLMDVLGTWDFGTLALKSSLFGAALALLSCYYGLSVKKSSTEIPKMATRGVITSIFACLLLDFACIMLTSGAAWSGG